MKIAVTGKGGVGKTTFAATLARLYAAEGRPVLAADVDPDANLGLALGFDEEMYRKRYRYHRFRMFRTGSCKGWSDGQIRKRTLRCRSETCM